MKTFISSLLLIRFGFAGLSEAAVMDVDPVSVSISGLTRSVIVQGGYAYCEIGGLIGANGGLRIFDVSNPANPIPVAFYEAGPEVNGLAVVGSYAYIGVGGSLHVIDISNQVIPRLTARYDGDYYIQNLAVAGNHAYLAGRILQVIDLSDPASPRRVGTYGTAADNISGVFVAGNCAYLANSEILGTNGFVVLDVSNPASPQKLGNYPLPQATDVFVFSNYAYVGSSSGPAPRQILDVSDPANPRFVRHTPIRRFVVSGNYGYTEDYGGLGVLDISNPGDPQLIGRYREIAGVSCVSGGYAYGGVGAAGLQVVNISEGFIPRPEWVGRYGSPGAPGVQRNLFASGSTVYMGNADGEFEVLDVSDPANPLRLGSTNGPWVIQRVFVSGHHAYVVDENGGDLHIIDVSDAANPIRVGGYAHGFGCFVSGRYAYVFNDQGLEIVDVGNPAEPRRAGLYALDGNAHPITGSVHVSGNYAYLKYPPWIMQVVDVSDPANSALAGQCELAGNIGFVSGNYVYAAGGGRFEIVDVSNPSVPLRVGLDISSAYDHATGLVVSGNFVYVAAGADGLYLIDVSDPTNPRSLGRYETYGRAESVFVTGTHAFVQDEYGLQILDVGAPPNPLRPVGEFKPYAAPGAVNVVISGNRAYVGNGWIGRFDLVDVSDPSNPRELSSYHTGGYAGQMCLSGDYAYMTDGSGNTHIVNVRDPANPRQVGGFNADNPIYELAVSGDHAHVATEMEGVQVFDVSDPSNPQRVARYSINDSLWGLFISGNYSYLWSGAGAEIFDVSDLAHPQRVGILSTNSLINSVVVSGNHAYVGASDGLEVFDVSNPANPLRIGGHAGGFGRMIVSGDRAYVGNGRLEIFDVSEPAQPRRTGIYHDSVTGFAIAGDYAFLADPVSGNMEAIRVNHPANPQRVGSSGGIGDSAARGGVSVSGSHAFVADGTNGLLILDVSDPTGPLRVASYNTPGSAEDVFVSGDHAFVADWNGGLQMINVNNPANPQFVASLALPDHEAGIPEVAERVVVSGNHAFVTGYALHVVDVSNPAQPLRVGGYAPPGGNLGIFVEGQYAYLVTGGRLHIVDVSNPASPQLVGSWAGNYLFPPPFYDVFVSGGFACVAAGNAGVLVFDVRNPTNPRLVGWYGINNSFSGGEDARSVHVVGRHACVMDRMFGLCVLDISHPLQPRRVGGNPNLGDYSASATDLTVVGDTVYAFAGEHGLVILDLIRDPGALRLELLSPEVPGSFRFRIHGQTGLAGRIERSANLRDWTDWRWFTLGSAPLEISDPEAGSSSQHFYRAVSP